MTADNPMQEKATMAPGYANLWNERTGLAAFDQRPYPRRL
jgi:hypothetical protein